MADTTPVTLAEVTRDNLGPVTGTRTPAGVRLTSAVATGLSYREYPALVQGLRVMTLMPDGSVRAVLP